MQDLRKNFSDGEAVALNVHVPPLAMEILDKWAAFTQAEDICIGGGFVRGLYMQQDLGLQPEMNDIDIFAKISVERFETLCTQKGIHFDKNHRYQTGYFDAELYPRGLIEFALTPEQTKACAGVKSVQLNYGEQHPWASPDDYVRDANAGVNQIAITRSGRVIASPLFVKDMENKTMTMNEHRGWTYHDWKRTYKSLSIMTMMRPEFHGWTIKAAPQPALPDTSPFWDAFLTADSDGMRPVRLDRPYKI